MSRKLMYRFVGFGSVFRVSAGPGIGGGVFRKVVYVEWKERRGEKHKQRRIIIGKVSQCRLEGTKKQSKRNQGFKKKY